MNERNLSQRLSTSIIDTLRARGHIAVARGGAAALARELEDRLSEDLDAVAVRLDPMRSTDLEVTVTYADDGAADEQVDELVGALARALLSSDHVEDVFAEEPLLRRELLRTLRDALIGAPRDLGISDEGPARLRLDTLGYLAAMVARRAPVKALRAALDRAAQSVGCKLNAYDPETREATFSLSEATFSITVADPEARLDLEQAVVDELADLVSANVVALPAVERQVELGRAAPPRLLDALRGRIDAAAARILRQGGCQASWELDGERTLKVSITPLSDKDAADVTRRASQLAAEVEAMLGEAEAPATATAEAAPAKKAAKAPAKKAAKAPAKKAAKVPAKKAAKAPAKKAAKVPAKKAAKKSAKASAKKGPKKSAEAPAKKAAKAPAKKATQKSGEGPAKKAAKKSSQKAAR